MLYFAPGDILLTRNTDEVGNDESVGYWNHAAIVSYQMTVIEAQPEPGGVIEVTLGSFIERYPEIQGLYYEDGLDGHEAGRWAETLVGQPYKKYASAYYKHPGYVGENCTSVVNKAFASVLDKNPGWVVPKNIQDTRQDMGFIQFYHKMEYETWTMPKGGWWGGRIR